MEPRLGGPNGDLEDGGTFFEGEVVLITEQEYGSAGWRDMIKESQEAFVRWLAESWVKRSEVFRWRVVKRLPSTGAFEMRESDTRSDPEGPGAENGGFAQEREFAEDLERCLLEDVVCECGAGEMGDVAAQRRIGVTQKLFQRDPIAGLSEKDQQGLVGCRGLLRLSSGVHV